MQHQPDKHTSMNRRQFILGSSAILAASVGDLLADDSRAALLRTGKMPVMFVGHGSPLNAVVRNEYHQTWVALGERLPRPGAILVISAHWRTLGVSKVMSNPEPETIHDFSNFPDEMYELEYPAPGSPHAAGVTNKLLRGESAAGAAIITELDEEQGLDHGTWCVLMAMYPKADIPVYQLSIDIEKPAAFHYELGQKLAGLRLRGVLIMGSGNLIHNLQAENLPGNAPYDWAQSLEGYLGSAMENHDDQRLVDAPVSKEAQMRLAHPTLEHYYPLLYALGSKDGKDQVEFFNDSFSHSSIAMHSVLFSG